jgi:hypothetical protein
VASSFDAFGNNNAFSQNNAMAGNVQNMATAFGNMTVGQTQQMQAPVATDDEFGDFADAAPKSPPVLKTNPSDPLAKLVSLDGLSKNPKHNARKCDGAAIPTNDTRLSSFRFVHFFGTRCS